MIDCVCNRAVSCLRPGGIIGWRTHRLTASYAACYKFMRLLNLLIATSWQGKDAVNTLRRMYPQLRTGLMGGPSPLAEQPETAASIQALEAARDRELWAERYFIRRVNVLQNGTAPPEFDEVNQFCLIVVVHALTRLDHLESYNPDTACIPQSRI